MNWYQIKFKSESWHASAWQADTIWGQLCWGLKYMHGEDALLNFLSMYEQGNPPILLSNGFPDDFLPRPILPELTLDKSQSLKTQRETFEKRKIIRDITWLTQDEFISSLSGERLFSGKQPFESRSVMLKNQINRLSGTTGGEGETGGHLFSFEQYKWDSITIYARIADDFLERARELFEYLARSGYGKRKTVGYGQLSLETFQPFPGFTIPEDYNGFVTLSNFIPAASDPRNGYWDIIVKYGKLGEEFATGSNPFKTPLVMFSAGSCFYDSPYREFYGRLVTDVSPRPEKIVQYAYALPVPIRLSAQE